MLISKSLVLFLLISCGFTSDAAYDSSTGTTAANFAGTLLQFDKLYADHCFMLLCMTPDCTQKGTYVIQEKTGYLEDKGWAWSYDPPHDYVLDGRTLEIYPKSNGCWDVYADTFMGIETEACPCTLDLYEEK